ncbi:MAG: aldehyde dehydrogenase family protein [candidate division KSB1 bacterium]|nr:aldehyde dehydrogenase family protein [candidate division KSB1 bacterium]
MAQMFINGEWTDAVSGEVYEVRNPANGEVVDTAPLAGEADVEKAVAAAKAAFPLWAKTPADERAKNPAQGH